MKKLLFATVFTLASFSVQAQEQANTSYPETRTYADITNPFYNPERGYMADTN